MSRSYCENQFKWIKLLWTCWQQLKGMLCKREEDILNSSNHRRSSLADAAFPMIYSIKGQLGVIEFPPCRHEACYSKEGDFTKAVQIWERTWLHIKLLWIEPLLKYGTVWQVSVFCHHNGDNRRRNGICQVRYKVEKKKRISDCRKVNKVSIMLLVHLTPVWMLNWHEIASLYTPFV